MVALFITLDILEIRKLKLTLNEYLTLYKFYHDLEGKPFPYIPDDRYFDSLLERNLIVKNEAGYTLSSEGIKVFNSEDLFEEFYKTFPHKVPTEVGFRPVSTQDVNSSSAKATRAIWDRITKGKPNLQRTIIDNLKRELEYKKSDGSLGYLQNIDTWLRQATWEKWNNIPDKKRSSASYIKL